MSAHHGRRILTGLALLDIELDDRCNAAHAPVISSDASRVAVRVIPTDERLMIARAVWTMTTTVAMHALREIRRAASAPIGRFRPHFVR
jgi:acetate kinase